MILDEQLDAWETASKEASFESDEVELLRFAAVASWALPKLIAEVRRLLAERLSYKAKLVDQRWEIEQAAAKKERERIAALIERQGLQWGLLRSLKMTHYSAAAQALIDVMQVVEDSE